MRHRPAGSKFPHPKRRKRGQAATGDRSAPPEVVAVRKAIDGFLNATDSSGRRPSNAECGVYVFYDFDGEPIYVGRTKERLRARIRRHLTNQRTDAVAMNVLDPFEVAEVEVYPFYDLEQRREGESDLARKERINDTLGRAEYAVYRKVLKESALGATLNEKDIPKRPPPIENLPDSVRGRIVPDEIYSSRKHPDTRIARRAKTIAELARVVGERNVSTGLRTTLLTQVRRLEMLANERLEEVGGSVPQEAPGEETGDVPDR